MTATTATRACPICEGPVPEDRSTYCSSVCARRSRTRKQNARKLFLRHAKRPVSIEAVAKHFRISVEEATARAERDIASGRLVAWRHRDGRLAEVSTPRSGRQ